MSLFIFHKCEIFVEGGGGGGGGGEDSSFQAVSSFAGRLVIVASPPSRQTFVRLNVLSR